MFKASFYTAAKGLRVTGLGRVAAGCGTTLAELVTRQPLEKKLLWFSTSNNKPVVKVSGRSVSPITQQLWEKRHSVDSLLDHVSSREQTEFVPKSPEITSITFPFSEDPVLVEQYRNPWCV